MSADVHRGFIALRGTTMHENQAIAGRHKSGWKILEWCAEAGISRSSAYNLLTADPPRLEAVKFGRSRIILTPPAAFLASLKQQS